MKPPATSSRSGVRTVCSALAIIGVFALCALVARPASAEPGQRDDAFSRCQQELQARMSREVGGRQPDAYVDERRVQINPVSNAETRVRGTGRYLRDSNDRGREFSFDCSFNTRNGSARATFTWEAAGSAGGRYPDSGNDRDRDRDSGYGRFRRGGDVPAGRVFFSGGIVSRGSGRCLDVEGRSNRNAASVQQWTCSGGSNQLWDVIELGRNQYAIISQGSNKALTVSDGGRDGGDVEQFRWTGGESQRWRLERAGNSAYRIVSQSHTSCLDVEGAKRDDGARVQVWGCSGGANQSWLLRK
jgi:Ricin-type beta-trefoil lectin domain